MYDYHVHSSFSSDCSADMTAVVAKAVDLGIKELCFTDHIDKGYRRAEMQPGRRGQKGQRQPGMEPGLLEPEIYLPDYFNRIEQVRRAFSSQITVLAGIELGVEPSLIQEYDDLARDYDWDFVMASMHTYHGEDFYGGNFFEYGTPEECYRLYYEELLSCARSFDGFNVVGHLDLLKRCSEYKEEPKPQLFFDILEKLFINLIQRGKGIEVNTSGLRNSHINETLPSLEVIKLYRALGGEIITLGSDSHYPEHLGYKFPEAMTLLKDAGFRYITTFSRQMPKFIRI